MHVNEKGTFKIGLRLTFVSVKIENIILKISLMKL